mmetsp:Transcript_24138/g.44879  ORF Transcript_24138/g.44879 Transcript_24138/m.44879 type:complete len:217 (-) Transcript_24138:91-741(-)
MGSEEVGLCKGRQRSINTDRLHEAQRFIDLGRKSAVSASFIGLFDEIQVPSMETGDISVTTSREGSQNVQSLRTLVVSFDHIPGIMTTSFCCKFFRVDNVTAVGRKADPVSHLIGFRTRLGKLSGHASNLDDRHGGSKGQNESHLKQDTEGITNVIYIEFFKSFSAIASHQQESLSTAGTGKLFMKSSDFSSKHQRRAAFQFLDGGLEFFFVLILW